MSTEQKPHSRPDVGLIQEALEYQEAHSLMGPLFPEAQQELRRLVEQLEALQTAAREVLDYENAPSRASLSRLRTALASTPASEPKPGEKGYTYLTHDGTQRVEIVLEADSPASRCKLEVPHPAHKWDTGPSGAGSCPGLASNQETSPE